MAELELPGGDYEITQTALPEEILTESVPAPPTMQLLPPPAEIVSLAALASTSFPPPSALIVPVPVWTAVRMSAAHSGGLSPPAAIARVFLTAYDAGTVALAVSTDVVTNPLAAAAMTSAAARSCEARRRRLSRRV